MYSQHKRVNTYFAAMLSIMTILAATGSVYAANAMRDLSNYSGPGAAFTISISIQPPMGTTVVAVEEIPPAGWTVSNISDGGTWDVQSEKIKWGLFFDPSIPEIISYDVTSPLSPVGEQCFNGIVSFDGTNQDMGGDLCIPQAVPTLSAWGLTISTLFILIGGAVVIQHQPTCDETMSGR